MTSLFSKLPAYNELLLALVLTGPTPSPCRSRSPSTAARTSTTGPSRRPAAISVMLPIVAFMMFLHRHVVRGLAFEAVTGSARSLVSQLLFQTEEAP